MNERDDDLGELSTRVDGLRATRRRRRWVVMAWRVASWTLVCGLFFVWYHDDKGDDEQMQQQQDSLDAEVDRAVAFDARREYDQCVASQPVRQELIDALNFLAEQPPLDLSFVVTDDPAVRDALDQISAQAAATERNDVLDQAARNIEPLVCELPTTTTTEQGE